MFGCPASKAHAKQRACSCHSQSLNCDRSSSVGCKGGVPNDRSSLVGCKGGVPNDRSSSVGCKGGVPNDRSSSVGCKVTPFRSGRLGQGPFWGPGPNPKQVPKHVPRRHSGLLSGDGEKSQFAAACLQRMQRSARCGISPCVEEPQERGREIWGKVRFPSRQVARGPRGQVFVRGVKARTVWAG
jgi:hypothetical protein